jgi:hypothetical protein
VGEKESLPAGARQAAGGAGIAIDEEGVQRSAGAAGEGIAIGEEGLQRTRSGNLMTLEDEGPATRPEAGDTSGDPDDLRKKGHDSAQSSIQNMR